MRGRPVRLLGESMRLFEAWRPRYERLRSVVEEICREETAGIRCAIVSRVKRPERLLPKLREKLADLDPAVRRSMGPEDVLRDVSDLAGVRITTYVEGDRERVVRALEDRFGQVAGASSGGSLRVERKDRPGRHYRGTHCIVTLSAEDGGEELEGLRCEIQVCSLLAHVWNELEHDLVYKPMSGALGDDARKLLDVLGQSLMASDGLVDAVIAAVDAHRSQDNARLDDPVLFSHVLGRDFGATNFQVHATDALEACRELGLKSRGEIRRRLLWHDGQPQAARAIAEALVAARARDPARGVLKIDPDSADLLLLLLIADDATRAQLARRFASEGRGRPRRVMALIRAYEALPREALPEVPRNARMRVVPRA